MRSLRDQILHLRQQPLLHIDAIRARIDQHLQTAQTAAQTSPFVDLPTAATIHAACTELLNDWDQLTDDARLWAQVACLYFADPDDSAGEPDFDSIVGFDDDLDALNHCLERIGRPPVPHPMDAP
ncbi:MAG: hypothetical protein VX899_24875 [Myxococcota bacterium]|nr:hypothetical protein [Myxococcota bacterium]